ncbi:MAG: GerW family sporulation protein [Ruminococcus flavefaciens]|nr:GerW family sporulation protein [Ruminococcus flavefaciens]MCM1229100.1 GerW family sporulation protein [Ruminococcus flavefaciens]
MDKKTPINELLGISMEKVREMADVNSIIGDPITTADGTTVIPISKVTYGFASGGSDLPSKYDKDLFAGGAGAGISIKPEGFLVISPSGDVRMVTVDSGNDNINSAINAVPTVIEKIQNIIAKKKAEKEEISEVSFSD